MTLAPDWIIGELVFKKVHERFICKGFYFLFITNPAFPVLCILLQVHTEEYMVLSILSLSFF